MSANHANLTILDEGYLVCRTGADPSTGDPWKPTWVSKRDCGQEMIAKWEGRNIPETVCTFGTLKDHGGSADAQDTLWATSSWHVEDVPAMETSCIPLKRASWDDAVSRSSEETNPTSVVLPPVGKRPKIAKRDPYGPLQTGFKSNRGSAKRSTSVSNGTSSSASSCRADTPQVQSEAPSILAPVVGDDLPELTYPGEEPSKEVSPGWLLQPLTQTRGLTVQIKHSFPDNDSEGWAKGDYEGIRATVLSVLNVQGDPEKSTALVKLSELPASDGDHGEGGDKLEVTVPVKYLWTAPPSEGGQNAVVLSGPYSGQVARLRELEEDMDRWLVTVGKLHFEIEMDALVGLVDI